MPTRLGSGQDPRPYGRHAVRQVRLHPTSAVATYSLANGILQSYIYLFNIFSTHMLPSREAMMSPSEPQEDSRGAKLVCVRSIGDETVHG